MFTSRIAAMSLFMMFASSAGAIESEEIAILNKVLGVVSAGEQYCPSVEARPGIVSIAREKLGNSYDYDAMKKEEAKAFANLRSVGSRSSACDQLMDQSGPGSEFHIFQFK